MGIEHQIARLTAKGPQLNGTGFGGIAEISQTDIAAALSGLHGSNYLYMRYKFVDDASCYAPLVQALAWQIIGEAMTGEGVDVSAKAAPTIVSVAIQQATRGGVCEACNGTGHTSTLEAYEDCQPCKATGRLNMTQDKAAALIGVSTPTYVKRFEKIVNTVVGRLELYESNGLAHVSRRLYGKKDNN